MLNMSIFGIKLALEAVLRKLIMREEEGKSKGPTSEIHVCQLPTAAVTNYQKWLTTVATVVLHFRSLN